MDQPILETRRLQLRPFVIADAPVVHCLAGDRDIARTTQNIPHPYEPGMAESWIATHPDRWAAERAMMCAVVKRDDRQLVGAVGLQIDRAHQHAELGYWIGRPYWGNGYATEAAHSLVGFGFTTLRLHRILARHFSVNPASGRVMQKIGMRPEGVLRHHVLKWGEFHDVVVYGMLAGEMQC